MTRAKPVSRSFDLQEVLNEQTWSLVVGPGGSGKTTALHWLAFKMAKQSLETITTATESQEPERINTIPVLVTLSRYEKNLKNRIRKTLELRGIKSSEEALEEWLKQNRIFLLLDGFDEVNDKQRFIDDLEELMSLAPTMRMALTSRAHPGLSARPLANFSRYEVGYLDDSDLIDIFRMNLDADRAERLFRVIENQHLLEAFQQPLMAWLISLAYRESFSESLPVARGTLYQTVIERNFLRQWEGKHHKGLIDYQASQKIACLARIGYEMVLQNTSFLEEGAVETFCRQEIRQEAPVAAQLLEHLYTTGLMEKTEGQVAFRHQSFRDYFAAVWLKNHFDLRNFSDLRKILILSWHQQWHDTFITLMGLLDEVQGKTFLRWMLIFAKLSLSAMAHRSISSASNQLFLTVKCLCNTREPHNDLKDSFIELITGRRLLLSATSIPTEQVLFFSGDERIYLHFYTLIGQLGTKSSLEFLQQGTGFGRRSRICGLSQLWNMRLLLEEFEKPSDGDSLADEIAAYFILRFPPDVLLRELGKFFEESEAASKKKLLSAIYSNTNRATGAGNYYKRLGEDDRWFHLLMGLALHDSDSKVRDEAFLVCRNFGKHQAWLPAVCEQILLEAIREEEGEVRKRAFRRLIYATSTTSLDVLIATLDDDDVGVALTGLHALSLRDRNEFPYHLVKLLKRLFGSDLTQTKMFQSTLKTIQSMDGIVSGTKTETEVREAISYLITGAFVPEFWVIREFSVEALLILKFKFIVPFLEAVFVTDEHEKVREKAFLGLTSIMREKAEPFIYKAFEDSSPTVRDMAVNSFYYMPMDVGVRALPRLRALMEEDPDENVRRSARIVSTHHIKDESLTKAE